MSGPPERTWGTPVRLKGGRLTHWAGRETQDTRLLAHGDYAWTDRLEEPAPHGRDCPRCVRRQPYFIKYDEEP